MNLVKSGGVSLKWINDQINKWIDNLPNKLDTLKIKTHDKIKIDLITLDNFKENLSKLESSLSLEQFDNTYCQLAFMCQEHINKNKDYLLESVIDILYTNFINDMPIYEESEYDNILKEDNINGKILIFIEKFFNIV
jgi:hypothetical protein